PGRAGVGTVVDRTLVRDGPRVDVDDPLAVVVDDEPAGVGDLTDDRGLDVPLGGDGEELLQRIRPDDRHHALLRLGHEDLTGGELLAQEHLVQLDVHAAVAVGGELGGGAGDTGGAEVLDALDDAGGEHLQAALDEHLLHEGVADLDGGPLGGAGLVGGGAGEDGGAADAVAAGAGAEEHDLVAHARGVGEVDVLVAQHAEAQRVDERVALVGRVELGLAADVGQAQAVGVPGDAGDGAVDDARGVRVVDGAEAQLVDDGHRPGAHRDDVADDSADAGGRPLVGLHEARAVVRLDLEGHRPAVPDVDDAGVLADPHEEVL